MVFVSSLKKSICFRVLHFFAVFIQHKLHLFEQQTWTWKAQNRGGTKGVTVKGVEKVTEVENANAKDHNGILSSGMS